MSEHVLVAMSGGIDSSVAALQLKELGCKITGVTLWLCGTQEDFREKANRAKSICDRLSMNHRVVDMRQEFEDTVVRYFIDSYKHGKTPNPCAFCNRSIKFGRLLDWAFAHGFDAMATGHYANIEYNESTGRYVLQKGADTKKDQSYFLYGLTQNQLKHTRFPLGNLTKEQIRDWAGEMGYDMEAYRESQEACFVDRRGYVDFIKKRDPAAFTPGNFVDANKNVLGTHKGVICYTVGQRKGLGLALGYKAYVTHIDAENNEVHIGDASQNQQTEMRVVNVNMIKYKTMRDGCYEVKTRYTNRMAKACVHAIQDECTVHFEVPHRAITPGQAAVFYENDDVVGGGTIAT